MAWASHCPGSHAPHAGPAGTTPWAARTVRRFRRPGAYHEEREEDLVAAAIQRVLDYDANYVVCAVCGKSVQVRQDGTARSHPPSHVGPEKEAARRARAAKVVEKELADTRTTRERNRDDLIKMLETL